MAEARALYAAASYDAALAVLGNADDTEALQYRGLCLLALGRADEARATLERLVHRDPSFSLTVEDASPRVVALYASIRQAVLPAIVRDTYTAARERLRHGQAREAGEAFALVAALAQDADLRDEEGMRDLGELALGFAELAAATAARSEEPAAEPAAVAPNAGAAPRAQLTTATAIAQALPPWPGRAGPPPVGSYGVVRVQIGADGRVKSALIERRLHPEYDRLVLVAARAWRYHPSMVDGRPIATEKTVSFTFAADGRSAARE